MSDLNPITRREVFLAAAGGQQVETPEPITREEKFLKAIADNAGGERTVIPVTFEWDVQEQVYNPQWISADVYNHPEKYDLLCTFSGGRYAHGTTMFRYGARSFNRPFYFGIMDFAEPSSFAVNATAPDPDSDNTLAYFVGRVPFAASNFIVTLTPTALDYSGTMDKTPQEITAAYNAGQKIVFDIPTMNATVYADQYIADGNNVLCAAKVFYYVDGAPVLITIVTHGTDDTQTYDTGIYALTPAS